MGKNGESLLVVALWCVVSGAVALPGGRFGGGVVAAEPGGAKLDGWATSREELITRFLEALRQKDGAALERLRVNEEEYVEIILPGSVPEGQPLRTWPREVSAYFFRDLDTKSRYSQQQLLANFGGHRVRIENVEYEGGVKRYANHVAHRQLRLTLKNESGEEAVLETGSIAEIEGRFKFISFVAD